MAKVGLTLDSPSTRVQAALQRPKVTRISNSARLTTSRTLLAKMSSQRRRPFSKRAFRARHAKLGLTTAPCSCRKMRCWRICRRLARMFISATESSSPREVTTGAADGNQLEIVGAEGGERAKRLREPMWTPCRREPRRCKGAVVSADLWCDARLRDMFVGRARSHWDGSPITGSASLCFPKSIFRQ